MSSEHPSRGPLPVRETVAHPKEHKYIEAMSRPSVVEAYSAWRTVSDAERLCVELAVQPGARILDVGCGAGRFARYLLERSCSYIGVDASPQMIEAARENCPGADFSVSDILKFEADSASFDVVLLMGNVLDCLQPESRRSVLLSLCKGWLNPQGALVGSSHLTKPGEVRGYYTEDYHGMAVDNFRCSLAEALEEVESHGFEIAVAARDYRKQPADWSCWVARLEPPGGKTG
jgi:SAM-dependent methyltransferase